MNFIKLIQDQNEVIDYLKYKLNHSKDKINDIERINKLIKTSNAFNDMLVSKYKLDALEVLILSRIENYFYQVFASKEKIPIDVIVSRIDFDLNCTKEFKMQQVVDLVKDIQLNNVLDEDLTNDEKIAEFTKIQKSDKEIQLMIKRLINQFKRTILWNY